MTRVVSDWFAAGLVFSHENRPRRGSWVASPSLVTRAPGFANNPATKAGWKCQVYFANEESGDT